MGTFFFFLVIAVVPGFPSGALVGRWGLLALCSATLLFKTELPKAAWVLLAYLAVMAWYGPVWYEGVNIYLHAAFFVVLYCYAKEIVDLRKIALGVALGVTVNSAAALAQLYLDWNGIPQITPGAGLYFNRNIASETAAMALALAVGYRLWWTIPGILPTLALGSRLPVVALGFVGALALYRKSRFLAAMSVLLPVLVALVWLQGHGDAIVAGPLDTLKQRWGTWYDGAHGFTILGQGLGSWIVNFPLYQAHSNALELRWENAHNDAVQLLFELGVGGAVLVAAFLFRLANSERNPAFYALVVFAVESCFGFPLYQPVTGALAMVLAGFLFGRGDPVRDLLARLRLRIWPRHADPQRGGDQPGGGVVSVQPRPPVWTGLSRYSQARPVANRSHRQGAQI